MVRLDGLANFGYCGGSSKESLVDVGDGEKGARENDVRQLGDDHDDAAGGIRVRSEEGIGIGRVLQQLHKGL